MQELRKYIFIIIGSILLVAESCKKDDPVLQIIDKDKPEQDVFTNGTVIKYIDNGDADNRINMVFIGDGFATR